MKRIISLFTVFGLLSLCGCAPTPVSLPRPGSLDVKETPGHVLADPTPAVTAQAPVQTDLVSEPTPVPIDPVPTEAPAPEEVLPELVMSGSMDVYSISGESFVRAQADAGDLGADEYYSFVLHLHNRTGSEIHWEDMCVSVDGGEAWHWTAGSLADGQKTRLHIYHVNMSKLAEGNHEVNWYMNGEKVYSECFFLKRDLNWAQLTTLPTQEEIDAYTNPQNLRSPYMAMWLDIPHGTRYTEYSIDFKADYLPLGTYCALGNWMMDYTALQAQYAKVETQGISAYAGFQNIHNGDKMAIMSFWDVYCTDRDGTVTTLRPRVIYPESAAVDGEFGNEGTGAQCIDPYPWEEKHWYRMHLKSYTGASGTTIVEMAVTDLETHQYTLLSAYDTLLPDSAFKGPIAIFLENYLTQYAGEIRTMEVRNAMYLEEASGQWKRITGGTMHPNGGAYVKNYAGSYDYGAADGRLWIMTTGVGNRQDTTRDPHVVWE